MFIDNFQKYSHPLFGWIKMPRIEVGAAQIKELNLAENPSQDDYLRALMYRGLDKKISLNKIPANQKEEYIARMEKEFKVISDLGFTGYILLVYDILRFCRENNILNSPSRGSVGGSLICYLIEITKIDSIKYNLLFSRFLSADRTEKKEVDGDIYIKSDSLPDIDIDSTNKGKPLVKNRIDEMFPGRTVGISNISTLTSKVLIKEVLKSVLEWKESETHGPSNLIEKIFGKVATIKDSLANNKLFQKWAADKEEIVEICCKLQDLIKNKSVHAAGVLICDGKVNESVPIEFGQEKELVCSYDMESAQSFGIKIDNLAVLTLDICQQCAELAGVNIDDIDVNDPSIYQFLNNSDCYYGLFQVSEGLGKNTLKKIKPTNINDISVSVAIGRPGSMKWIDEFVKNEFDIESLDPRVREILRETHGIIVYQETLMQLAMIMAKFTGKEANTLRKGLGKKIKSIVVAFKDQFVNESIKNGFKEDFVNWCWGSIEASADYSFNKCIFEEEEIVEEKRGKIMLKDVAIGDRVKAYDIDENANHFVEVLDKINGERDLYEITTEDKKKIRVSLEHKILCYDFVMRSLKEILLNNDRIITNNRNGKIVDGVKIVSFTYMGKKRTVDLEVNHKDHNFICNNIVVSNSHSTGYGALMATSCFLKANHPKEFFLSCLAHVQNTQSPMEEISKIQSELRHFGIQLLPPHIIKSQLEFSIEDNNIRFGLAQIKGISEKSIQKLTKFRNKYSTKFDIFKGAKEAGISISILSSLILVGALDTDYSNRSELVAEAHLWNLLTPNEKELASKYGEKFNYNLIEIMKFLATGMDENGKRFVKDSRLETLRRDYKPYQEIYKFNKKNSKLSAYYFERQLLGYAYSFTLRDIFSMAAEDLVSVSDVNGCLDGEIVHFTGEVVESTEFTARNEKKTKTLRYQVKDETGAITVLLFNERIETHKTDNGQIAEEGDIVVVKGKKKGDSVFADRIGIHDCKIFMKTSELEKAAKKEAKTEKKV